MIIIDNLKKALFKDTLYAQKAYYENSKFVPDACLTCSWHYRLKALLKLIESAGLETEYEKWKHQQERGDKD